MVSFDAVADEYDAARPSYPAGVFDALGPLAGLRIIEGGAGTGIATRALLERGGRVVPFDLFPAVLGRAVRHSPGLPGVLADGGRLPFCDSCADLLCFAQSWHWLPTETRVSEAARVLAPTGRWAGWWSHPRADDEDWFDQYWTAVEHASPGTFRTQRDTDWGAALGDSEWFEPPEFVNVGWVREISVDDWLLDQSTHSTVVYLPPDERARLMATLTGILRAAFPDGRMAVPFETWMWIAPVAA